MFDAFFQEYVTIPALPLTAPAVTDPVLPPKQDASVLLEAANDKAAKGPVIITGTLTVHSIASRTRIELLPADNALKVPLAW